MITASMIRCGVIRERFSLGQYDDWEFKRPHSQGELSRSIHSNLPLDVIDRQLNVRRQSKRVVIFVRHS